MLSSLRCFLGIAIGTIHRGTHHGTSWPNKNSFPKGLKGLEEVIYIQVPGIVWEAGKRSFRTTWETNPPIRHYLSMTLPTNMYKNGMNMSRWSKYSIDVCLVQQLWYVLMNISRWTKSVVFVCCCGIPWEVLESFCIHGDLDLRSGSLITRLSRQSQTSLSFICFFIVILYVFLSSFLIVLYIVDRYFWKHTYTYS